MEIPVLERYHREERAADVEFLGISLDGSGALALVKAYATERDLSFPNLVARPGPFAGQSAEAVGERLRGTPTYLVFDPDGRLLANNPGRLRVDRFETYLARKRKERGG